MADRQLGIPSVHAGRQHVFEGPLLTCDKGSIGDRTSCLRLPFRLGLGSLLCDEVAFDTVLCNRPGEGRLDKGVSGLPAGMVNSRFPHACVGVCRARSCAMWPARQRKRAFRAGARLRNGILMLEGDSLPLPSPTLDAVPGRPEGLSNSKLVLLPGLLTGLMVGDIMAESLL